MRLEPIEKLNGLMMRIAYFRTAKAIAWIKANYAKPPVRRPRRAGSVGDEWVVQMIGQGNSGVFKKYSEMKLTMKREALHQPHSSNRSKAEMRAASRQPD